MTEINYRTQVAAQVEADAVKEKVAANDAAWNEIIDRYAIRDADDNRNMVEIFCSGVITLQKFKLLADHPPAGFNLRWSDEKTLRAELIDAILEQLHDPTGKRFTDHAAKTERVKMSAWSLRMLRNRLAEIRTKQYFAQFSAAELKAGVKEVRKSNVPRYAGYENLPSVHVPRGFTQARDTSEFLRQLARGKTLYEREEFQYYCERWGVQQITDYLNNRT